MNYSETDNQINPEDSIDFEGLPNTIQSRSALCIAKPAPLTDYALPLHITNRYADHDDCRIIVTPSVDAEETIHQQETISPMADNHLGVIDTTANKHRDALYQPIPIVYRPHPGELAQITLALGELDTALSPACSKTHLILRSLTPSFAEISRERIFNVLKQLIKRQQSNSSLTVFSVQYTEHNESTMTALAELVDAVIWVEQGSNRTLRFDYQQTRNP